MSVFTVYDVSTGRILRIGNCPQTMIAIQAQSGEAVIPDMQLDGNTQYIVDGVAVPRTDLP